MNEKGRNTQAVMSFFISNSFDRPLINKSILSYQRLSVICLFLFTLLYSLHCPAKNMRYASLIIDDLGNNLAHARQLINLPAVLTFSILPQTRYAKIIARDAIKHHREVMLHLPLQSVENRRESPGTLELHMTKRQFLQQLRKDIDAVPYISGINNHMGSLLTRHPGYMDWLMAEIGRRKHLFFVDSRTTSKTIAGQIAREHAIPTITRDVFLDPDNKLSSLKTQFHRFMKLIKQRGYALAIAHPHPKTIMFLKAHLNELKQQGIRLVPVSKLIKLYGQ